MLDGAAEQEQIIGRIPERKLLGEIVDKTRAGERKGVIVLGPPGIGKTTLMRWTQERAAEAGFLTASVRAPSAAGLPPRFPVGEILEGLIAGCSARGFEVPHPLRRVVDTLRGTRGVEPYPAQLPQIAQALEETARHAPVAIFIDDYQWAPSEGVGVLVAAARVIDGPVLFALTARDERAEGQTELPESTSDLWFDRIEIDGLTSLELEEFIGDSLGGRILPSLLSSLLARTDGNPLIARELLRFWIQRRSAFQLGGFWGLDEDAETPTSLHDIVARRFRALDDMDRDVLFTLALWGRDVCFTELTFIPGLDGETLLEQLSRLEHAGYLHTSETPLGPAYRLLHPIYEQTALSQLDRTRSALIHQRIFEALTNERSSNTSVAELAHHAVSSLQPPKELPDILNDAALEASHANSFIEAARWYGHVAEHLDADSTKRKEALLRRAMAMTHFAPTTAIKALDELIGSAPSPLTLVSLLEHRADCHRVLGNPSAALADLNLAFNLSQVDNRAPLKHKVAVMHGILGDVDRASKDLTDLASVEDSELRAKALGHLGQVAFIKNQVDRAGALWTQASALSTDMDYLIYLRSNLNWLRTICGQWGEAEAGLRADIASCRQRGDAWNTQTLLCSLSRLLAWSGRGVEALDAAVSARRVARQLENPACLIAASDAIALAFLETGRPSEAVRQFDVVRSLLSRELEPRELSLTLAIFAEAHLLSGHMDEGLSLATEAQRQLSSGAGMEIAVDRVWAQILLVQGDVAAASARLDNWVASPSVFTFEQARVHELKSDVLLQRRDKKTAYVHRLRAAELFRSLPAPHRLEPLDKWLEVNAAGKRGRPPSTNLGGLTDRELDVLMLVARSLTNLEIADALGMTIGTAKKHVENIQRKLGTKRRSELISWALRFPANALPSAVAEPNAEFET